MKEATASPKDVALKLALAALEKSTKYFNIVRLGESRLKDTEIRGASHAAITAIKEALAQPDYRAVKTYHEGKPVYVSQPEQSSSQVPVKYEFQSTHDGKWYAFHDDKHYADTLADGRWPIRALYTTPPKRPWGKPWVSLTDEDYLNALDLHPYEGTDREFWKVLEAKLKELNT